MEKRGMVTSHWLAASPGREMEVKCPGFHPLCWTPQNSSRIRSKSDAFFLLNLKESESRCLITSHLDSVAWTAQNTSEYHLRPMRDLRSARSRGVLTMLRNRCGFYAVLFELCFCEVYPHFHGCGVSKILCWILPCYFCVQNSVSLSFFFKARKVKDKEGDELTELKG